MESPQQQIQWKLSRNFLVLLTYSYHFTKYRKISPCLKTNPVKWKCEKSCLNRISHTVLGMENPENEFWGNSEDNHLLNILNNKFQWKLETTKHICTCADLCKIDRYNFFLSLKVFLPSLHISPLLLTSTLKYKLGSTLQEIWKIL